MRTKHVFLTSGGVAGVRFGTGFKPYQHTTNDIYDEYKEILQSDAKLNMRCFGMKTGDCDFCLTRFRARFDFSHRRNRYM